jgi:subtilase family serine protease
MICNAPTSSRDPGPVSVLLRCMRPVFSGILHGRSQLLYWTLASVIMLASVPARSERIPQTIDNTNLWRLRGSVQPRARAEFDRGTVDGSLPMEGMKLVFQLTPEQQSSLDMLLRQQLDPSSPNYHAWLTPEQYAERFGVSRSDIVRATKWLRQQGFTTITPARSRTWIGFNGSAAQVEAAFHTPIHQYFVNGKMHYANAIEPSLPSAFHGVVMAVSALNDFRPKPHSVVRSVNPHFTSELSGKHFLAPDDFATIYDIQGLYGSGINGSGEAIAVMGQTDLSKDSNHNNQYDVQTFRSVSNLPAANLQVILVPGQSDPGSTTGDQDEANLDLEWSGAVARSASLIYVNSKNALFDSLQYAVDQNLAPVISISYGLCEAMFSSGDITTLTMVGQQASAQGQTIVSSSGDSGPADCDFSTDPNNPVKSATHGYAVDVPASLPYVTGMGGTEFSEGDGTGGTQYWNATNNGNNGSAISYIPEMVWNDTATDGSLAASGGGVSTLFTKPSWQTGTGVPADGQRDVPDLALSSSADHDGYLICSRSSCVNGYRRNDTNQTLNVIGGTSAAAPTFAGIVALLVQQTNQPQGNVNPILYGLAGSAPNAFHDTTVGDNMVPCTQGTKDCPASGMIGYSAGPGYDLTTGLGSVDVGALAAAWNGPTNPDFRVTAQSDSLAITRGFPVTDLLTVTGLAGYSTSVSLTCMVSATLTNTTCSVNPGSVTPGGTATLTVTATSLTANLHADPLLDFGWPIASSLVFAVGLFFTRPSRRDERRRNRFSLLGLFILCILLGTVSCGGGGSNSSQQQPVPQPQTGTVTIQATSGSLNHTVVISVTAD